MDFFSSQGVGSAHAPEDIDGFAAAINSRFGDSGSLLTARLVGSNPAISPASTINLTPKALNTTAPTINLNLPFKPKLASPMPPPALSSPAVHVDCTAVTVADLPSWLQQHPLILDIRTRSQFDNGRLPSSLNLNVPSTLLKRPAYSLEKLAGMLSNPAARHRFLQWKEASRILVLDTDSNALDSGPGNLSGLVKKLRTEGYSGQLGWLHGGFSGVWKEAYHLISTSPPDSEEHSEDEAPDGTKPVASLRAAGLPSNAFNYSSTTNSLQPRQPSSSHGGRPTMLPSPSASRVHSSQQHFNPFYDTVRQNVELSQGITERIPLRLPLRIRRRINDLPFKWLRDIASGAEPIPEEEDPTHDFSDDDENESSSSSESDDDESVSSKTDSMSSGGAIVARRTRIPSEKSTSPNEIEQMTESLAMQFYKIELAEQRRMMGIMEYHSKEPNRDDDGGSGSGSSRMGTSNTNTGKGSSSTPTTQSALKDNSSSVQSAFPYSITAGVEKGSKNRYRHIWPFEHARVKLGQPLPKSPAPLFSASPRVGELRKVPDFVGSSRSSESGSGGSLAKSKGTGSSAGAPSSVASLGLSHLAIKSPKKKAPSKSRVPYLDYNEKSSQDKVPIHAPQPTTPEKAFAQDEIKRTSLDKAAQAVEKSQRAPDASPPDDYINASYVQPMGTHRRYIATQGPMEATFADFWRLVWEQNISVILMLTREIEGNMVKCGTYWRDGTYGHVKVECINQTGTAQSREDATNLTSAGRDDSSFFPLQDQHAEKPKAPTITRTFMVWHDQFPKESPRTVTHLQYLDWPDMNVPNDARGILKLVSEVGAAYESNAQKNSSPNRSSKTLFKSSPSGRSSGSDKMDVDSDSPPSRSSSSSPPAQNQAPGPVLLHCSAGVGRTGGYIAIDAVLDGVRREYRKMRHSMKRGASRNLASTKNGVSNASAPDGKVLRPKRREEAVAAGGGLVHVPVVGGGVGSSKGVAPEDDESLDAVGFGTSESGRGHTMKWAEDVNELAGTRNSGNASAGSGTSSRQGSVDGQMGPSAVDKISGPSSSSPPNSSSPPREPFPLQKGSSSAIPIPTTSDSQSLSSDDASSFDFRKNNKRAKSKQHKGHSVSSRSLDITGTSDATSISEVTPPVASVDYADKRNKVQQDHTTPVRGKIASGSLVPSVAQQLRSESIDNARSRTFSAPSGSRKSGLLSVTRPHGDVGDAHPSSGLGAPKDKWLEEGAPMSDSPMPGASRSTSPPKSMPSGADPSSTFQEGPTSSGASRSLSSTDGAAVSGNSVDSTGSRQFAQVADGFRGASTDPHTRSISLSNSQEGESGSSLSKVQPTTTTDELSSGGLGSGSNVHGVDYKEPRTLHSDTSISPLGISMYPDPIWTVVEDMREQRMSLCQSLRQYIFVHAAVIEGALMIVDEEKANRKKKRARVRERKRQKALNGGSPDDPSSTMDVDPNDFSDVSSSRDPEIRVYNPSQSSASLTTSSMMSKGKRPHSPTEPIHEDKTGKERLSKRPSVKRKHPSDELPGRSAFPKDIDTPKFKTRSICPP